MSTTITRQHYLPQPELVEINLQSIRNGYSMNLVEEKIAKLDSALWFPIVDVWSTTFGGEPIRRLFLAVGPNEKELALVSLDVSESVWEEIQEEFFMEIPA